MNFIALQMLFGDRGKYIAMVIGITFASLIMTQQPSIFVGLMSRTYSYITDVSEPDVWVMDKGVQYVDENKPLRDTDLARVRGVAGVEWAVPLYRGFMIVKLPTGETRSTMVNGLDDATLVGAPVNIVEGKLENLRMANAIIVDKQAAETKLRITEPDGTKRGLRMGDELEINDKRAVVVGFAKTTRNFITQPLLYTTYSRAVNFAPSTRRMLTYVVVKAKPGVNPEELAERIAEATDLQARTRDNFKHITMMYWLKNTGIPINFGISVTLGFLVGTAIAGQSFFNFVRENLKQYAALKAMGLRNAVLVRMVVLQALVVGTIGYGIGVGLTALFGTRVRDSVLAFMMHPYLLLFAAVGVTIIVTLSALLAIRQVIKVDPAVVFRA
jgi:putative ABC transport system permease protein